MKEPKAEVPRLPTGAEKIHSVFAYAFAHTSLHDHLPLPSELSRPRACVYDPDVQSEDDFMLSFLLSLRKDAKPLSMYVKECYEKDPGVPLRRCFDDEALVKWNLQNRCIYCGNMFFSYRFKRSDTQIRAVSTRNKFKLVKSKERTLPCRHHLHLELSSKLQA